jgi:nucleoside-diphosphate-sugar epimerase
MMVSENCRIFITGGDGFLGKHLRKALSERGIETFSYDIIKGDDINDYQALEKSVKMFQPSMVIHLAAISDLNIFKKNEKLGHSVNVEGTKTVLKICNTLQIRMLFASTCCIYGNNECHPSDEESPTFPTEPYAQSKKLSEADVLSDPANPLGHTCLRLATFYGPAMRKELAPAIFITKAYANQPIEIHGKGNQTRTFTYVDDIVSGIVTVAVNPYKYPIINVTNTESISVLEIARLAQALTRNPVDFKYIDDREGQIKKEEILNDKLKSLGWIPKVNFAHGMIKSYEYFVNNGFKFD